VWLTGVHPRKTAELIFRRHFGRPSRGAKHGHLTRFASLELGHRTRRASGNCDSGYSCAYSSSISWRGESTPVAKEINPRLVFDRLFGNGNSDEAVESRQRRDFLRKSVLDFVMEDARDLKNRLGVQDNRKLDEYLSSVRDIEQRVARASEGALVDPTQRPTGIPSDPGEHIRCSAT
jgi:hypothetical protein